MIQNLLNTYLLFLGFLLLFNSSCQTNRQVAPKVDIIDCKVSCPEVIASVKQDGKWGFIDTMGQFSIAPRFLTIWEGEYYIIVFYEGIGIVRDNETKKVGAINNKGEWLLSPEYHYLHEATRGIIIAEKDSSQELRFTTSFELETFPQYEKVGRPDEEGYSYVLKDGLYGCINKKGDLVIPFQSYDPIVFIEGLASVDIGGEINNHGDRIQKHGFINPSGKMVIPPIYNFVYSFNNGYAIVIKNQKHGLIDTTGKLLIPHQFSFYYSSYNGFRNQVEFAYDWEEYHGKGAEKMGLLNLQGKWVVEPSFENARTFYSGVAPVMIDGKWGLIDTTGHWILEPSLDDINAFSEGLAAAKSENLYGYIDRNGQWIITPKFEEVQFFRLGFTGVKKNDKWGFINRQGELVIDYQYEAVGIFHNVNQNWTPDI